MKVKAVPLTAAAFRPYGQVLEASEAGEHRREYAANAFNSRAQARLNTVYMKATVASGTVPVKLLERHPFSNQMFVPMNGTRNLVCVCPSDADGNPILSELRAFVAGAGQAFNFDPMVWHAPKQPVGGPGELVMQRWDDGTADDTELRHLDIPIDVDVSG